MFSLLSKIFALSPVAVRVEDYKVYRIHLCLNRLTQSGRRQIIQLIPDCNKDGVSNTNLYQLIDISKLILYSSAYFQSTELRCLPIYGINFTMNGGFWTFHYTYWLIWTIMLSIRIKRCFLNNTLGIACIGNNYISNESSRGWFHYAT